jgi:polysaccharide export outer membrane protein
MGKMMQFSYVARVLSWTLMGGFLIWLGGCSVFESSAKPGAAPAVGSGVEYLLGAEDVLAIAVWKDEHLTKEVVVRPDGFVSFPLVGEIQAAGRTVEEVRAEIAKRLAKFIPNPNVSVAAIKVLSYRVYVLGRVNKPGEFMIGHTTDVLQALSLAGGLTPFASENDIRIIRRSNGEQQVIPVPYGDLKRGKNLERNALLQRGDVVMVP